MDQIDISKLSKDYIKEPIQKISKGKYSYEPTKEDYEYLYLDLNLNIKQIANFLKLPFLRVYSKIRNFGIKKDKESFLNNRKQTKLLKYGNPNYNNIKKNKQTKLERYGDPTYSNSEKANQTKLLRYGTVGYNNRNKSKQTKLERYGDPNYNNRKKAKDTTKERYGYENAMQNPEVKEKLSSNLRQTFEDPIKKENIIEKRKASYFEKTGYNHPSQNPEIKLQKLKKIKETILTKFGSYKEHFNFILRKKYHTNTEEALQLRNNKIYQTKKSHNSFNSSKPEESIHNLLLENFPDCKRWYKEDPRYPFECDFYIPSLDLFIEINFHWTHGKYLYNKNDPNDQKLVDIWKVKAKELNFKGKPKNLYKKALEIWTVRDVHKREVARKNNLNYLEFFTKEQFFTWYNDFIKDF